MADLSPQAQAVLDAAHDGANVVLLDIIGDDSPVPMCAAAALRAAADQLKLDAPMGDTDADVGVFAAHQAIRANFLAIAAELEGTNA